MSRSLCLLLTLASLLFSAPQKGKAPRPPDIQILEISVRRQSGHVALDGRVRNTSGKTLKGLVLFFEFFAPGKQLISRQNTVVSEEPLEPGDEAEFHVQTVNPARSVHISVDAEDTDGRYLRVGNSGPFPIE